MGRSGCRRAQTSSRRRPAVLWKLSPTHHAYGHVHRAREVYPRHNQWPPWGPDQPAQRSALDQVAGGLPKGKMKRREWFKAAGLVGAALMLPANDVLAESGASEWRSEIIRLKLRHSWTTTMSSS